MGVGLVGEFVFEEKVEAGVVGEVVEGEAGVGAEEEGDAFEVVLLLGEVFGLVHGVADSVDLFDVGGGVGGVFPAGGVRVVRINR